MADTTNTDTTAASGAASQPEALRLADLMNKVSCDQSMPLCIRQLALVVFAELRRLHALTTAAPAAQEAEPAIQWQKRHPDHEDGAWRDCSEGDAKWWQEQNPEWEVRRLSYTPQSARSAPRPQADAGAVPASQDQYLCQAWGETELPAAAIVAGLDAVSDFLVAQWLGDAEHEYNGTKTLPAVMEQMHEGWALEGEDWKWSAEFEIGGISVQKVFHAAAPQAPAAPTAAAAEQPGVAHNDEVLPLLVRDIANDLGRPALEVIGALRALGLGNYSVNTAVTKAMATRLRQHFEAPAPAAGAAPNQHITQPYTVAEIRERMASGDYSAELMLQHAMLHLGAVAGAAPTDEENEVSRQAFNLWYAIRHPKPTHENPTWAHARKCDDYEVWRAASAAHIRRIAELEAELAAEPRATNAPTAVAAADPQLLKFYGAASDAELIAAQVAHIERLQAKLQPAHSFAPQRVREG